MFFDEINTCFMACHVAWVKYVAFLRPLIWHTAVAHACVSPLPSFGFISKKEMKWKKKERKKKTIRKSSNEIEQNYNKKVKTKWKQKQNKQNKIVILIKQIKSINHMSVLGHRTDVFL